MNKENPKLKVDIDVSKNISKSLKLLARNMDKLTSEMNKQPHIRIDFDNIRDVPKVYVDGVDVASLENDSGLVALHLDWITNDEQEQRKHFLLTTFNCKTHQYESVGQDSGEGATERATR